MKDSKRRLIAIDIENICMKPIIDNDDVIKARNIIEAFCSPQDHDAIIIGTSGSTNFLAAGIAWPKPLRAYRNGHNGADLALIEKISTYDFETISEVIIFGGDGIYAPLVDEIAQMGIPVCVYAYSSGLSSQIIASVQSNNNCTIGIAA